MKIQNLNTCQQHLLLLAQWHHDEWQHFNTGQTLQDRTDKMQGYLNEDFIPSTFVALDSNQQPLGSAAIVAHDMKTRPELSPWLASVFVTPEHRRQGIGEKLVKEAMQQASLNNIEQLYLFTEGQAAYYQKLGWKELEETDYCGQTVTIMTCNVVAQS